MKTITKIEIEKEIDDLQIGWYEEKTDERHAFDDMSEEQLGEFCKREDFRMLLVEAITQFVTQIHETIGMDLADLWKRMDRIENENPD